MLTCAMIHLRHSVCRLFGKHDLTCRLEHNDLEKELQQRAVALSNLQTSMKASVKSYLLAHPTCGFTA